MRNSSEADISHRVRFETATRYYCVFLQVDLFGDWIVTRAWGGKDSRLGQIMSAPCTSREHGLTLIEKVRKHRLKRGYFEVCTTHQSTAGTVPENGK